MSDEEALKKHDLRRSPGRSTASSMLRFWGNLRRRRIILGLVAAWLLYIFFKNLPTDVPPVRRRNYDSTYRPQQPPSQPIPADIPLNGIDKADNNIQHDFEGPVKFYHLAPSLRGVAVAKDAKQNVLFAVSGIKSSSNILPMACEMAHHNRTRVNVALMGREEIDMNRILSLNGISPSECPIVLHDARPDYTAQSSTARMEKSVKAALGHLHAHMAPCAVLVDDSGSEATYFTSTIQEKANQLEITTIFLPKHAQDRVGWLASLDGSSLKQWNEVQIDIVVQAPRESSGSLTRLLKSMKEADYTGFSVPKVTIELPAEVDVFATDYLHRFKWPPRSLAGQSKMTLRHRIQSKHISSAEASLRTVESFYPATAATSHVLMLSPDIELSQSYFHYLMFNILEYKYSQARSAASDYLVGLSLELPTQDLGDMPAKFSRQHKEPLTLWQGPNDNAALYFGEKWAEMHSFLTNRLVTDPDLTKSTELHIAVSKRHPAWLKSMLELMRARGYYMLYPTFAQNNEGSLVTFHKELHQSPDESEEEAGESRPSTQTGGNIHDDQPLTADGEEKDKVEGVLTVATSMASLMSLDSDRRLAGRLPHLLDVPLRAYGGEEVTWTSSQKLASDYADDFSLHIGGCSSLKQRDQSVKNSLEYLFCLPA